MHVLIAILLAIAGPLLLDEAFRNNRVWAAFLATLWLLLSLFLVGLNSDTAWRLIVTHPLYSAGAVVLVATAFFFIGPGGKVYGWVVSRRLFRTATLSIRGWSRRRGISRRAAGDVFAIVAALLLLVPVSLLTLKPHPAYEYAVGKVERELLSRLPDAKRLSQEASAQALEAVKQTPIAIDREVINSAQRTIAAAAKSTSDAIGALKAAPERLERARNAVNEIAAGAPGKVRAEMESAARRGALDTAGRLLDETEQTRVEAVRAAMTNVVTVAVANARHSQSRLSIDELRDDTSKLVSSTSQEVERAGREAAEEEAKSLLTEKQSDIERAWGRAAGQTAEQSVRGSSLAMAQIAEQLKQAVAAGDDGIMTPEKRRRQELIEARDRENREAGFTPNDYIGKRSLLSFDVSEKTKYSGWLAAPELAADSLGECAYYCLRIQCFFFTYYSGSPKSCRRLMSPVQIEGGGEFNTSARRR